MKISKKIKDDKTIKAKNLKKEPELKMKDSDT